LFFHCVIILFIKGKANGMPKNYFTVL